MDTKKRIIHLQTQDLTVGYQGIPLIRDIRLAIEKGEIVTLIGPNGAGKSTILKSIIRQLQPVAGKVLLDMGKGLTDLQMAARADQARHMAVVLTERTQTELMTCREVAAAGRYPYTGRFGILTKADYEKVDEALAAVHALDIADKDFSAISDGQRQRILLARAFCQEPEIIVLDEPTSFLDIRYKTELLTILREMARKRGITVILSLHEIDLAMKLSDRIICVKGEKIFAAGRPEEIFEEERIRTLYEMEEGYYDPLFGSLELPKVCGEPQLFVLSSGGSGIPVYRRLQREGVPFAAGILYENDIDYRAASHLAAEVISEKAFMTISEEKVQEALALMHRCGRVINAGIRIGDSNRLVQKLIDAANDMEKENGSSRFA